MTSKGMPQLPFFLRGVVVKGFGRGAKELGCPTANFSDDVVEQVPPSIKNGIYYGFAQVDDGPVHKMVVSIGWNPFYKNTKRSFETHVIHEFPEDFYGQNLGVVVCGYLRDEKNYESLEALKEDIQNDIRNAVDNCESGDFAQLLDQDFFKQTNNNKLTTE